MKEERCRGSSPPVLLEYSHTYQVHENTSNAGVQHPEIPSPHFPLSGDVQCHYIGIISVPENSYILVCVTAVLSNAEGGHSLPS